VIGAVCSCLCITAAVLTATAAYLNNDDDLGLWTLAGVALIFPAHSSGCWSGSVAEDSSFWPASEPDAASKRQCADLRGRRNASPKPVGWLAC
jgi:hypothetical protein